MSESKPGCEIVKSLNIVHVVSIEQTTHPCGSLPAHSIQNKTCNREGWESRIKRDGIKAFVPLNSAHEQHILEILGVVGDLIAAIMSIDNPTGIPVIACLSSDIVAQLAPGESAFPHPI